MTTPFERPVDHADAESHTIGPRKPHVMVVEDDANAGHHLSVFLSTRGYEAIIIASGDEAIRQYHDSRPAAVILDVGLAGPMDGLHALGALRKIDRAVPIIALSGRASTTTLVQAMKLGAAHFITQPFDDAELERRLANALSHGQMTREVASLRGQLNSHSRYSMLFGRTGRMNEIAELIDRIADTDVTVLIRGETGTGKELIARALHTSSQRSAKPFVKVNCAAIPTELLESELFGFERGAFTGAIQHKPGKFEFANHGTMFLDEIGDIRSPMQSKLMHVLQNGEFSRLGGSQDVRVDVRVIAATNRDLEAAIADGQFRKDLFFRLNVVAIELPPLRDRREDIEELVDHFLKKHSVQHNRPPLRIAPDTLELLTEHDWPGNIRELENVIKRAVVLGTDRLVRRDIAGAAGDAVRWTAPIPEVPPARPGPPTHTTAVLPGFSSPAASLVAAATEAGNFSLKSICRKAARDAERELMLCVLQRTHWNRKQTAQILGISYKALLQKIKENGLDKAS